ncbi:hypothetical protein BPA01_54640 [Brevibacillus parabrevis]|uniref:Uncharacterized protein n=1 Tax=Brevibacillus parabrevis TaxID=54914 RepID=A0A4Y3PR78_BREPA|nr:hypothetical protein BPA01_54640 [Brevibacillus parabrevis]
MGVLMEEARRSDIWLWFEPSLKGYVGVACDGPCDRKYYVSDITAAPYAICLVFLKATGVIGHA